MSDELGHAEVEEERPHQDRGAAEHSDVHIGQSCAVETFFQKGLQLAKVGEPP